jgi:hypothetical protein
MWVVGTLCLIVAAALTHLVFGLAAAGAGLWLWGYLLTEDGDE